MSSLAVSMVGCEHLGNSLILSIFHIFHTYGKLIYDNENKVFVSFTKQSPVVVVLEFMVLMDFGVAI